MKVTKERKDKENLHCYSVKILCEIVNAQRAPLVHIFFMDYVLVLVMCLSGFTIQD